MILTADKVVIAADTETREYLIDGSPDQLDQLEALFDWVTKLCSWGHSASAEVHVDGDGSGNIRVEGHKIDMEEHDNYNEQGEPELSIGIGG